MTKLSWARMLVKVDGRVLPKSIEVVAGAKSFDIQLWWEIPPRIRLAKEFRSIGKGSKFDLRVEGDVVSSAKERVRDGGRQGL